MRLPQVALRLLFLFPLKLRNRLSIVSPFTKQLPPIRDKPTVGAVIGEYIRYSHCTADATVSIS